MTVEFVNLTPASRGSLVSDRKAGPFGAAFDRDWVHRYARTIEDYGFDYTLVAYGSNSPDQFIASTAIAEATTTLKPMIAVRPNTAFPTVAAQSLSTLDQLSGGRVAVHIISGGADDEQRRQGDYLGKQERYERSSEFVQILRDVWTKDAPFSHDGKYYKFEDFGPGFPTFSGGALPVSLGGSSAFAYQAGGALADIFALWGEPLKQTQEQIDNVNAAAREAGRTDPIRFWVTFRVIVAETDELAWAKAGRELAKWQSFAGTPGAKGRSSLTSTNIGSVRLRDIAEAGERHDSALYTPRSIAGAGGASSWLVGSPETIADAIVEYVKLGADIVSLPSLGNLDEAIDTGRYVIPLVHQKVAALGLDLRRPESVLAS